MDPSLLVNDFLANDTVRVWLAGGGPIVRGGGGRGEGAEGGAGRGGGVQRGWQGRGVSSLTVTNYLRKDTVQIRLPVGGGGGAGRGAGGAAQYCSWVDPTLTVTDFLANDTVR